MTTDRMKKFFSSFGLVGLGFFSFFVFLYFLFPYNVMKETLTSTINKSSPVNIRIGELGPDFPLGLSATDLVISSDGGSRRLKLESATVNLSVLKLLIGKIGVDVELGTIQNGELNLGFNLSIGQLIAGNPIPSRINVVSENFLINGILDFGLSILASSPTVNPLFKDILTQINLKGKMNGLVDLDFDSSSPTDSEGQFNLKIVDGLLAVNDPSLNIAEQSFSKFLIKGAMADGKFVIDKSTGIKSQELTIGFNGNVALNKVMTSSQLSLNIMVKLLGSMKKNFGLAVDLGMGGRDGEAKMQIVGPLRDPSTIKM